MKATRTASQKSIEICPVHLSEWTQSSGVSEALAQLNPHSILSRTEIAQLLNWNYYGHTPGWYVRSVDLETGQFRQFGQFKPNEALQFPDSEKPQKYLTFPKGAAAEVILLRVDLETWQKVADRYNVPIEPDDIDENRLDLGFWRWVARHPELPVCPTEGIKKAACLLTHGYIPICLTGVWNGKAKGKLKPIPTLVPFLSAGRPVNLVFDADITAKKSVQLALKNLGYLCQKAGCIVGVVTWSLAEDTKGCDDLIVNRGIEAFEMAMNEAQPYGEWLKRLELQFETPASGMATGSRTKKLPSADIFGAQIAEEYRDKWLYCDELKSWLAYEIEKSGVWTPISTKYLAAIIDGILEARGISGYGTNSYIQNIIGKLERVLYTKDWTECSSREFLPFTNGVFEIATGKLHQHGPGFRLTWQLPRPYSVLETDWTLIDDWLDEVTQLNQEHKQLLLCFGAALLRGRSDLQKFLYIKGHGGNGKSVFTNLLTALIGEENSVSLDFPQLEDKHDIAQLFGKRLLIMPDQDKVPKRLSNFKKLTGGDRVNGRRLYENGFQFVFSGLTVITSNPPIFHSNLGTWLLRRLLMAPFDYQCPPEKVRTNLSEELSTQLTAFTNHLLSIPEEEIELVLKGIGKPKLTPTIWDSLCRNDGLTAWVNDWLIYDPDAATAIGSNAKEWSDSDEYSPERSTLFGSYCLHSRQTNRTPRTKENFSADLLELCGRTLGWELTYSTTKLTLWSQNLNSQLPDRSSTQTDIAEEGS